METIGGVPVDELKKAGLSNEDIKFIREMSALYLAHMPEGVSASTITIGRTAFESGLTVGQRQQTVGHYRFAMTYSENRRR